MSTVARPGPTDGRRHRLDPGAVAHCATPTGRAPPDRTCATTVIAGELSRPYRVSRSCATCTDVSEVGNDERLSTLGLVCSSGRPAASRTPAVDDHGDDRTRLHDLGQPGEEAAFGVDVRGPGALGRADPLAPKTDQGGGRGQSHQHRYARDGHAGDAERGHRRDAEDHQAAERAGHRQCGEQDGTAGRRPRPAERASRGRSRAPALRGNAPPGAGRSRSTALGRAGSPRWWRSGRGR